MTPTCSCDGGSNRVGSAIGSRSSRAGAAAVTSDATGSSPVISSATSAPKPRHAHSSALVDRMEECTVMIVAVGSGPFETILLYG